VNPSGRGAGAAKKAGPARGRPVSCLRPKAYFGGDVVVVVVDEPGGVVVVGPLGGVVVVVPSGAVVVVVVLGGVAGAVAELSVEVVVLVVALGSVVSVFLAQPPKARAEAARTAVVAIRVERRVDDVIGQTPSKKLTGETVEPLSGRSVPASFTGICQRGASWRAAASVSRSPGVGGSLPFGSPGGETAAVWLRSLEALIAGGGGGTSVGWGCAAATVVVVAVVWVSAFEQAEIIARAPAMTAAAARGAVRGAIWLMAT